MDPIAESTAQTKAASVDTGHSMLNSRFPVLVPHAKELTISDQDFASFVSALKPLKVYKSTTETVLGSTSKIAKPRSRLMDALSGDDHANHDEHTLAADNKTLTENADVAFASAGQPLVDAFYELKSSAPAVEKLLNEAWALDCEATLKLIFNTRSIHLGKADKDGSYKAFGWLYHYHPQTLLANLIWLARPVIEKKVKQEKSEDGKQESKKVEEEVEEKVKVKVDDEDDFEMVDVVDKEEFAEMKQPDSATFVLCAADAPLAANTTQSDVKYGVAHGYWKDLANILLLAVNNELRPDADVDRIFKVDTRKARRLGTYEWDQEKASVARLEKQDTRHERFLAKFGSDEKTASSDDSSFKALHLTIARLFASQLRADITALGSKEKRAISFAAKWCPSPQESHDKQTFIVSSIAEAIFPFNEVCPGGTDPADRTTYLKHARLALRTEILSPLRKHLAIVERNITNGTYKSIKYERIPSLAMARYSGLFLNKDEDRFAEYLERVTAGKAHISGAVLLPSVLVRKARQNPRLTPGGNDKKGITQIQKLAEQRLLDGQWKTLVKRIKDSGKIESAIAVCDVSGSMGFPPLSDGTTPMDSAIGLSLLLAEVCEPPFGGSFITFSEKPTVQKAGGTSDTRTFAEKVAYTLDAQWGMNTDFVAVFEKLLLPIAITHNLKQEEMVKQVFVFSDMQFDAAQCHTDERWTTSYERIKKRYAEAGYEMPQLVFWNLADGHKGAPMQADEPGVSLVSGYSQGMMKVFLDGGLFTDEVEEEIIEEKVEGEDGTIGVRVVKKVKKNPLATVKKAISHPAYAILKVVD